MRRLTFWILHSISIFFGVAGLTQLTQATNQSYVGACIMLIIISSILETYIFLDYILNPKTKRRS